MDEEVAKILIGILVFGLVIWIFGLAKDSTNWQYLGKFFMTIGGGPLFLMAIAGG